MLQTGTLMGKVVPGKLRQRITAGASKGSHWMQSAGPQRPKSSGQQTAAQSPGSQ